ncbi:proton myo-inositol cotransporter-like isoform X2 [Panulirus ornatus]
MGYGPETNADMGTPSAIYLLAFYSALGGFLFGYDTGVVSGAMILVREQFHLNAIWHEVIVSITIAAAWFSALVAGPATDHYGRRPIILSASVIFVVGAVIMGVAPEKITLLIGRFAAGIAIGFASMSVPVYLSEASPLELRGQLTVTNILFVTGGQTVSAIICGAFSNVSEGWRYMLGLGGVPAIVQLAGFAFLPESPRWLVSKGRIPEAVAVLKKIRPAGADLVAEVDSIKAAFSDVTNERGIGQVLRSHPVRRALLLGCLLQLFQQISGINTVMYYSASIITMAGVTDKTVAIWLSAATASVNFLGTLVGLWLVERVGRRPLTLVSQLGTMLALLMLGLSFHIAYINSSEVLVPSTSSECSADTCGVCTSKSACGFCFMEHENSVYNSSCLAANHEVYNKMSTSGLCANSTLLDSGVVTFAYDWCPYKYAWVSVLGLSLYLLFFSPGMGPMPWTINSEIYPGWARSTCNSLTSAVNWASNLLVSLTFLTLAEVFLKHGVFYFYMILAGLGFLLFFFLLPETRGVSLEDIETLFSGPLLNRFRRQRHAETR